MGLRSRDRACRAALALTAVVALGGCDVASLSGDGGDARPAAAPSFSAVPVRPVKLHPGDRVPALAGSAVLTVTGRIAEQNQNDVLALDRVTLDRLGVSRIDVFEPWTKQNMGFQGLWLADLLKVAGAAPDAASIHATALDDYQVDLTTNEIRAGGIFLATRDGAGKAIPIQDGGPTRIVFAGNVAAGRNADRWIWSLKNLDVR
jgi:hypothetical protein